jgi:hypothetical protein
MQWPMEAVLVCPDAHLQHLSPSVECSKQHMASQIVISTNGQCKAALLFLDLIYDSLGTSWLSFLVFISFLFSEPMSLLFIRLSPNGESQNALFCLHFDPKYHFCARNKFSSLFQSSQFCRLVSNRHSSLTFFFGARPLYPPAKLDNSLLSCCFNLVKVGS